MVRLEANMSPVQFDVQKARIEREASQARRANDSAGLRAAMAEMMALLQSYYGPHTGTSPAWRLTSRHRAAVTGE